MSFLSSLGRRRYRLHDPKHEAFCFGTPRIELGLLGPMGENFFVGTPRIELGLLGPKPSVLPVYYVPTKKSSPYKRTTANN